jgi:hypothetical protein
MPVSSRVQNIWLRLLEAGDGSPTRRMERVEEGYYAVVREAARGPKCHFPGGDEDFRAVKSFIPNLDHTRAVYLNHGSDFGLARTQCLHAWAGQLGEQIESDALHALAIVDTDIFAKKISARLHTAGWNVEAEPDNLRVNDGRFTEFADLLRLMVQMVLSCSTFADAARSLKAELARRFSLDAQLFERFQECFAQYRPAIIDRYFTVNPDGSRVAAGWDYWQVSSRSAHDATEIFDQAMKEFETLLAIPQEDWLPALATDCGEQSILNLEVTHD